jgi:predicted metal-dependent HD superfamily phosphohydrolase
VPGLLDRWTALADPAGRPGGASSEQFRQAGEALLARYGEPWRAYHDHRHLAEVLAAIDRLAAAAGSADVADSAQVARLAAWFHDAVYDPAALAGANEEASAALATEVLAGLGRPAAEVARVADLVRGTAAHEAGDDAAAAILFDADLAILASPAARYRNYVADVRTEYAHVADADFRAGRSAILRGFLERPTIYRTAAAQADWEQAARANITAELTRLSQP